MAARMSLCKIFEKIFTVFADLFFFLSRSELAEEGALSQAVAVFTWQWRWTNHSIGGRKRGDKLKITPQLRYEVNIWLQCGPRSTLWYENYYASFYFHANHVRQFLRMVRVNKRTRFHKNLFLGKLAPTFLIHHSSWHNVRKYETDGACM